MLGLGNGLVHADNIIGVGTGWLKVEFVSTQTGSPAIGIDDWTTTVPPSAVLSDGDIVEIDYKIWIDNSTGKWDPEGDNDNVSTYITGMGFNNHLQIPTNQSVVISTILTTSDDNADPDIKIATWSVADDKPQAGAVFYIKDVVLRANRGTIYVPSYIAHFSSDFSAGGSANMDLFNTNGTVNQTLNQSPDDI